MLFKTDRIDEQHATIKVTGPIKSEGEKATVEVVRVLRPLLPFPLRPFFSPPFAHPFKQLTQSDMIPRNIFPDGFATVVSATVGPDGKLAQVEARPKDMGEWTKLASLRDSEWRD